MSKNYYRFMCKMFKCYPFLVFRLLQSKYEVVFAGQFEEVVKLYELYIAFANTRKNGKSFGM